MKTKKNIFNPENIQPGDFVYLKDDPNKEIFKVESVDGTHNNKVLCKEFGCTYYANCFKKVIIKNVRSRRIKELNQILVNRHGISRLTIDTMLTMAYLADSYNSTSSHPYSLGDCILLKLNYITKKQVRRNPFAKLNK